ncbi:MAG: signal peptidase I [Lachnospiraceae bacterium]|nr:signal peptidase I [Lachnospiraceae bacterium]
MDFYSVDQEEHKLRGVTNWIVDIVVVIVFAVLLVAWFGSRAKVSGHSMRPVLETGDTVLVDRLAYELKEPGRLDIILYQTGGDEKTSIKRIIGLPGETIRIRDGHLYVNGELLELKDGLGEVVVPGLAENDIILDEDEYFVLGDNRDSSEDSRFENVGNVKRSRIVGKIWFRISPFVKLGPIGK